MNGKFNGDDYINAVDTFIDDNLFIDIDSKRSKSSNIFMQKGLVNLQDDII
jgi:hypothetical protein